MSQQIGFAEVLETVEQLDDDAQAELILLLRRRLAERGRLRVVETIAEARREFAAGQCKAMTPKEIVREALS